jgi:hypothetical protein
MALKDKHPRASPQSRRMDRRQEQGSARSPGTINTIFDGINADGLLLYAPQIKF